MSPPATEGSFLVGAPRRQAVVPPSIVTRSTRMMFRAHRRIHVVFRAPALSQHWLQPLRPAAQIAAQLASRQRAVRTNQWVRRPGTCGTIIGYKSESWRMAYSVGACLVYLRFGLGSVLPRSAERFRRLPGRRPGRPRPCLRCNFHGTLLIGFVSRVEVARAQRQRAKSASSSMSQARPSAAGLNSYSREPPQQHNTIDARGSSVSRRISFSVQKGAGRALCRANPKSLLLKISSRCRQGSASDRQPQNLRS